MHLPSFTSIRRSVLEISSKELETRKLSLHKFNENLARSGSSIPKKIEIVKYAVNKVLKRHTWTLTIDRKPGSGAKTGLRDKKTRISVMKSLENNPGSSNRDQAKKFNISTRTNFKVRLRSGYKSNRVIKKPNRTDNETMLRNNDMTGIGGCILMDDETFDKMDFDSFQAKTSTLRRLVAVSRRNENMFCRTSSLGKR